MKKLFFIYLIGTGFMVDSYAQYSYGTTGLVDGVITVNFKSTSISTRDGHIVAKQIVTTMFSTKLLVNTFFNSYEDYTSSSNPESLKGKKIDDMLATVLVGNNYSETLQQGQNQFTGPKPPQYEVTIQSTTEDYSLDPCGPGDLKFPVDKAKR